MRLYKIDEPEHETSWENYKSGECRCEECAEAFYMYMEWLSEQEEER